jgi:hypothetical protein
MLKHSTWRDVCIAVFLAFPILLTSGCSSSSEPPATTQVNTPAPAASPFEHKMIRRTGSTPEDAKVYVVEGGKKHWVVNADWFATHGYHFPGDVQVIPADDFTAIPTGDPIQ